MTLYQPAAAGTGKTIKQLKEKVISESIKGLASDELLQRMPAALPACSDNSLHQNIEFVRQYMDAAFLAALCCGWHTEAAPGSESASICDIIETLHRRNSIKLCRLPVTLQLTNAEVIDRLGETTLFSTIVKKSVVAIQSTKSGMYVYYRVAPLTNDPARLCQGFSVYTYSRLSV